MTRAPDGLQTVVGGNGLACGRCVATTWFDAPSLIEGAALAGRIVELSAEILVDLRATGFGLGRIRPRLYSNDLARPGTLSLDASGHYLRGA